MVELDALLSVIENPARRRILEALVREPHYPLQLSKELGMTQQAVIKHLKVLEAQGLVKRYQEESDLGGPMRHKYYPAVNFTIVVDVGPNIFNAKLVKREHVALAAEEAADSEGEKETRIRELRERMAEIDRNLLALQKKREELIEEKERTMDEVAHLMAEQPDYRLRKAIYEFINRTDLDPELILQELSLQDEAIERYLRQWLEG
ncbi:MAG: Helix-turn-helix domain protein [Methanomassiliicoccales archaeon PtaU1.Bin030]|nr:MAG: Helix-turn-helix domain protein [Methanomassiliicoccales archaeon PtaU1.Bin030]